MSEIATRSPRVICLARSTSSSMGRSRATSAGSCPSRRRCCSCCPIERPMRLPRRPPSSCASGTSACRAGSRAARGRGQPLAGRWRATRRPRCARATGPGVTSLRTLVDRAIAGPDYPPNDEDLGDLRILGLALPRRASIAVFAATALILVDQLGLLLSPTKSAELAPGLRAVSVERLVLFLAVPLAIVALGFQDKP